jgi:hypothetical protein
VVAAATLAISPSGEPFMSLSRRKGVYYYWYVGPNGKRKKVSTHATTKSKALEFLRNYKEPENLRSIRLCEFRDEILKYARQTFSRHWAKVYELAFRHLIALCGNIPLASLSPRHVDQYKLRRIDQVKGLTVNHEMEALRAALHTAVRWKLLKENPFSCFRKVIVPERKVEFFAPEEFETLDRKSTRLNSSHTT